MRPLALCLCVFLLASPAYAQPAPASEAQEALRRLEDRLDRGEFGPEDRSELESLALRLSQDGTSAEAERAALLLFLSRDPGALEIINQPESPRRARTDTALLLTGGATFLSLLVFNGALIFGEEMGLPKPAAEGIAYGSLGLSLAGLGVTSFMVLGQDGGSGDRGALRSSGDAVSYPVSAESAADRLLLSRIREDLSRELYYAEETGRRLRTVSYVSYGVSAASLAGLLVSLLLGNEAWGRYNEAIFTSDASELRQDVDRYERAAFTFGSIAVLSAGIGTFAILASPDRDRIRREIREIDALLGGAVDGYSSR